MHSKKKFKAALFYILFKYFCIASCILGIEVIPLKANAIQGKSISLQCQCKFSSNHLISTEIGIGGTEGLPALINLWTSEEWEKLEYTRLQNLYSIIWVWTPQDSQIEYDMKQLKNKLAGNAT